MAGNVKLMTPAGGGVVLDTATTTATDVTVKVPVTGVNNGTLVCSDSSGNVGIGTSSPVSPDAVTRFIDISGTGATSVVLHDGRTSGAGGSVELENSNGKFVVFTAGSERMRIDSSGNLLVGRTSNAWSSTTGVVLAPLNDSYFISNGVNAISCRREGSDGSIIGFYRASTNVGNINVTASATSYATSSDYRLKENIQPMQNALGVVQQLNPVTYTWKSDGSDGQGFIAHELQEIVPDCVTGEKDAVDAEGNPVYQGIDTSFLVATLTKAIQELSAKNDALEARLAALEAK